ncbi:5-oxoprolinase subunit PxpA [Nesterenkonia sp.]|uniref:LamB/YcsF family protein n=1 Tax=Nesterenkonia sp. TaxID=704201 RepID=UPI00261889F4|nr:5-oxoprolinase subunit PxpA [Nesterenkonia sp.]
MPTRAHIDLNSDLGESFGPWSMGDDEAVLQQVSSANIACGFHAGDPVTMRATAAAAAAAGVAVGAHVAYRDLAGFGRRFLDASRQELTADVLYQIGALQACAAAAGTTVQYVKPHGALYHACRSHRPHAQAVAAAVAEFSRAAGRQVPLVLQAAAETADSAGIECAEDLGVPVVGEVFADRAYTAAGELVSRSESGAVITDPGAVVQQVLQFVEEGTVQTADGSMRALRAETICLHGDTPDAVQISRAVKAGLNERGVEIRSFV